MLIKSLYGREELTEQEFQFLYKIVPLARLVQSWTKLKADFAGVRSPAGVYASLLAAEMLLQSDYGRHPLAQDSYNRKYSNNLALIPAHKYWKGKGHEFEGVKYRAYKDWRDFAVDYSDFLSFSNEYVQVLKAPLLLEQVDKFSLTKPNPIEYNREVISIITLLGLEEFDNN